MSSIFEDKRVRDFVLAAERQRDDSVDLDHCPNCGKELQETGSTTYCVDCGWFDSEWAE